MAISIQLVVFSGKYPSQKHDHHMLQSGSHSRYDRSIHGSNIVVKSSQYLGEIKYHLLSWKTSHDGECNNDHHKISMVEYVGFGDTMRYPHTTVIRANQE